MNTQEIIEKFNDKLTMSEYDFVNLIEFKELKSWCYPSRYGADDNVYIGKVNNRFFWYKEQDCKVWYDQWGFLDEIEVDT